MNTALGTIDAGGDGKDVLLSVINTLYGKNFVLDDFDFGVPEFISLPNPTHNSVIKLGPKAHTGYYGFRTIYYNRIHVSELGAIKVRYEGEQFLTQMLAKINAKYGILIKPADIFEELIEMPVPPATDISVNLQFRPESLVFYGGDLITLGTNDPSLDFDAPILLPFSNETVLFVNSTYPVPAGVYAEYSSVSLASDYIRQKSSRIFSPADDLFTVASKARFTTEQYRDLQSVLPFVDTWTMNDGRAIRGLNIYGDVLELDPQGEHWTFVSNALGLTGSVPEASLTALKDRPVFKKCIQSSSGDLFVISRDDTDNTVNVLKSGDSGLTWTKIALVPGDEHFSRYSLWDATEIKDIVCVGTKIYMLVWSNEPYSGSPTTDVLPPAVEVFNILTGETLFYPMGDRALLGLTYSIVTEGGIVKFVNNNDHDGLAPDVVALFATAVARTPVALYYRLGAESYDAVVIPGVDLEPKALVNGYYDIAGYRQKLEKDQNYLLGVEIIGRISKPTVDFELYMNTHERTETGFFNHGVSIYTAAVKGNRISQWSQTVCDLGYGTTPKFLSLANKGLRACFIYQGEVGLFKTRYVENELGAFIPTVDLLFKSGAQTGYNIHSVVSGGQYRKIKAVEYTTTQIILNEIENTEEDQNPIGYSFITQSDAGGYQWRVAEAVNTPLVERAFDPLYSHIGPYPLACASMEGNLFVWSHNGRTIHWSEVGGKIWKPYAATDTYYQDRHGVYEATAHLALKPEFFKQASLKNNKLVFQIGYENVFHAVNTQSRDVNEAVVALDEVLYEIDASATFDQARQFNSVYSARGLNVMSEYSPRKLIAWDTDTDQNILALAQYSNSRQTPYTESVNMDAVHADIVADPDFQIKHLEYDLVYLGLKHIAVCANDSEEYKLYATLADDTVTVIDLEDDTEELHLFKPIAQTHLWDATDDTDAYTPFILLGQKEVALFERVDVNGNYSITRHVLTVPNDSGGDLEVIPMFNDNRKEILVYQKGNGIFKFDYAWDNIDRISTVSLTLIFALSGALNGLGFISGCATGSAPVEPYGEVRVPVIPAYGTVLSTKCHGVDQYEVRADGRLGSYEVMVVRNSTDCGYIPPVPGGVEDGGANINTGL